MKGYFVFIAFTEKSMDRGREKHQLVASHTHPGPHNLGMCPDWGSNLQHFKLWNDAPTN